MTMNACGEWLDDSQKPTEQQRLSTLIILRDFALFTRPYFLRKASYYFQHIFKFIREHKVGNSKSNDKFFEVFCHSKLQEMLTNCPIFSESSSYCLSISTCGFDGYLSTRASTKK